MFLWERQYVKDLRTSHVYDHTTRKKTGTRSIPEVKTLSGEDSTWMVDRLEIPRIVDSLLLVFSFFYYMMK